MEKDVREHSLQLENEKYYYKRISRESFFLRKELYSPFKSESVDITGSRALIGTARVEGGSVLFKTNQSETSAPADLFGIYIPPCSIYTTVSNYEFLELAFTVSSASDIVTAADEPLLFNTSLNYFNGSPEQTGLLLDEMRSESALSLRFDADPGAVRIKQLIDAGFTEIRSLSDIAERLEIESWELSRIFKSNFGISPVKYLNNLRSIEAVYRLLHDGGRSKIIDVAFNVGFRDLSRFNKQFKKSLRFIPKNLLSKKY